MNCPGGLLVYNSNKHSYRELPMRTAELGLVHRYEASGMMHGLVRVRQFTQDDAHIFCTPEQIESEIVGVINLVQEMYAAFGFEDYHVELSTKPEKHIGSDEIWETATSSLRAALDHKQMDYQINEGDGAFVLRAEDRLPHQRLSEPVVAVGDDPARFFDAGAV
jgi:threonyl-tRNA synthetase